MIADLFWNVRRKPRRSSAPYRRQRRPLQPERLEDRRLLAMAPDAVPLAGAQEFMSPAVSAMEAEGEPLAKCLPEHNCDIGINQIYVSDEAGNRIDLPDAGGAFYGPVVGEPLYVRVEWSTHRLREGDGYAIAVTANDHTVIETFNAGASEATGSYWWVFPMGITQSGRNQIEVTLDATGQVTELNENNTYFYERQGVTSQWMVESITVSQNVSILDMDNTIWRHQWPDYAQAIADAVHTVNDPSIFVVTPKIRMWSVSTDALPMYYSWTIRDDKGAIVDSQHRMPLDAELSRLGTSLIEPSFAVLLPDRLGKYTLEFSLVMIDEAGEEVSWSSRPHSLYVLFGEQNPRFSTLQQLDRVVEVAAGVTTASAFGAMRELNAKFHQFAQAHDWHYTQQFRNPDLFGELANQRANCEDMTLMLIELASRLGIGSVTEYKYPSWLSPEYWYESRFVTHPNAVAFDGRTGNAAPKGSDQPDRWFFMSHSVAKLVTGDETWYFDPVFNDYSAQPDWFVAAIADEVKVEEGMLYYTTRDARMSLVGMDSNPLLANGYWEYEMSAKPAAFDGNRTVHIKELQQAGEIEPLGRGFYGAYGITLEIEGPPGEYYVDRVLHDGGRILSSAEEEEVEIPSAILLTIPASGSTTVTLRFPGKDLAGLPSIEHLQAGISIFDAQGEWVGGDAIDLPVVSPTSFLAPAVAAIDSIVPTAWDGDGDGKIDELRFQVHTSNVNASDLVFDGQLFTAEGVIARATPFGSGGQLRVPARAIQEAGFDGPYQFRVTGTYADGRTMDTLEIETEAYTVADFEDLPVQFTASANFTTLDRDENGRADVLRLETTIGAAVAGDYRAIALLSDREGDPVHALVQSLRLETGPQPVVLDFPGVAIGRHGKSGNFTVKAVYLQSLTSGQTVAASPHRWSTAHLSAAEFEEGPELAFHNAQLPMDTNNDGVVAPLDALLVINYLNLNANDTGQLPDERGEIGWIDVNGDGSASPLDALLVINYLNAMQFAEGEAAGAAIESLPSPAESSTVKAPAVAAAAAPISAQENRSSSPLQSSKDPWNSDVVDAALEALWFFDCDLSDDKRRHRRTLVAENHNSL